MRKIINRQIRKIFKSGPSYVITLPVELVQELKWKERQKLELVIDEKNQTIKISDWKE
ncbi:MAG: AbrB/MazE/SpoVT family DNA-binding domain-containing protein [Candidatus Magasanikbacteria bacterium]